MEKLYKSGPRTVISQALWEWVSQVSKWEALGVQSRTMSHPETPPGEEAGGFQGTLPVTGPIQVGQGHEVRSRHCTKSWSWVMRGPGGSPGHKPRCADWPAWFKPHHLPVKNKTEVPPWWSAPPRSLRRRLGFSPQSGNRILHAATKTSLKVQLRPGATKRKE